MDLVSGRFANVRSPLKQGVEPPETSATLPAVSRARPTSIDGADVAPAARARSVDGAHVTATSGAGSVDGAHVATAMLTRSIDAADPAAAFLLRPEDATDHATMPVPLPNNQHDTCKLINGSIKNLQIYIDLNREGGADHIFRVGLVFLVSDRVVSGGAWPVYSN